MMNNRSPKAEVTGSNPVGCASNFKHLEHVERQGETSLSAKCPRYGPSPGFSETKTAAQAGPLNGGGSEYESTSIAGNGYHNGADAATRAGLWYAENRENCPRPIVPALKRMFGLSALEAVQAIRVANGVPR
jgi:hypothetical protein